MKPPLYLNFTQAAGMHRRTYTLMLGQLDFRSRGAVLLAQGHQREAFEKVIWRYLAGQKVKEAFEAEGVELNMSPRKGDDLAWRYFRAVWEGRL